MAQTVYTPLASVDFDKIRLESVDRMTFLNRSDDSILLMMEDLKDLTISNSVDTVYQTGKFGVRLAAYDRNKSVSVSASNGYLIASAIAAQTGSDVETASTTDPFEVATVEYLTADANKKVTLSYDASGTTGAEFPYIYRANSDLTQGAKFPIAATASATEFSYDPTTKEVTLPTGFASGDIVIVVYNRKATIGKKITNNADLQGKSGKCILDCTASDICAPDLKMQVKIIFQLVKLSGTFDLSIGGDEPSVHNVSFESMPDPCSLSKDLFEIYVI